MSANAGFDSYRQTATAQAEPFPLLQLRVLGLGLFQDGDVWVGVFPKREEVFVSGERPDAGGYGENATAAVALAREPGKAG